MYFYAAKILINWELPQGWVSYLILAYSVVGILAILLVYPLKENASKSWIKIFSDLFYYTLIPLIILLFVAIFTRILEYGYTEARYFVLIIAIWLTSVVLYNIFIQGSSIKFIPISMFVFGFLSLTAPYLNVFSVAKRSQKSELIKTLTENKLLENGEINFKRKISDAVVNDISDKFNFLAKRNETTFLFELLPTEIEQKYTKDFTDEYGWRSNSIRNEFKNVIYLKDKSEEYRSTTIIAKNVGLDISKYRKLYKINYSQPQFKYENNTFELTVPGTIMKSEFILIYNGQKINLFPELQQLFSKKLRSGEQFVDELSISKKVGKYEIKIMFDSIVRNISPNEKEEYIITADSYIILIK